MAKRVAKSAVELASDIGSKALDLHQHGDVAAVLALRYLMGVNPEIFEWFRQQLEKAKQVANPYTQTEALIEQRTIGHGEGQEHATAEWQAALADRDATIARLREEGADTIQRLARQAITLQQRQENWQLLREDFDATRARMARLVEALDELRINANRLCDRQLGGTYEADCRRSLAKAEAALTPAKEADRG